MLCEIINFIFLREEEEMRLLSTRDVVKLLDNVTIQAVHQFIKNKRIDTFSTKHHRKYLTPLGAKQFFEERGFRYKKQKIAFQALKGGVGKTTLAFGLSSRATAYGAKVLVIDFDKQGNLTRAYNVNSINKPVWINITRDNVNIKDAIIKVDDFLDLVPSNLNNSRLEKELDKCNLRDHVGDKLEAIKENYDLIVLDSPPDTNQTTTMISCAADFIIIPVEQDPWSIDGLDQSINELDSIKSAFKVNFDYKIIWNNYDAREVLSAHHMHQVVKDEDKAEKIFPMIIRSGKDVKNSVFNAHTIFDLPRKTPLQDDIDHFTREILGINAWIKSLKNEQQ